MDNEDQCKSCPCSSWGEPKDDDVCNACIEEKFNQCKDCSYASFGLPDMFCDVCASCQEEDEV